MVQDTEKGGVYQRLEDDDVVVKPLAGSGAGDAGTAVKSPSGGGEKKKKVLTTLVSVVLWILLYQVAASFNLVAVKLLNYNLHFQYLLFIAVLQKSGFVFSITTSTLMNVLRGYRLKQVSNKMLAVFVLLGFLGALTAYATSVGLNTLSGSTYALLKTSDLVFNVILSKLLLKKRFTIWHYFSVLLILVGVSLNVIDALRNPPSHSKSPNGDVPSVPAAAISTIAGAFLDALTSVISDKLLKQERAANLDKSRTHSSFYLVLVFSSFSSFFAAVFLIIPLFATKEQNDYPAGFQSMANQGYWGNGFGSIRNWVFILICIGISGSRFLVRLSRYYIVMVRSAFTFAVVKPLRRVFTIALVVVLFGESFSPFKALGMVMSLFGFASYIVGSRRLSREKAEKIRYLTPLHVPPVNDFMQRLALQNRDADAFWSAPRKPGAEEDDTLTFPPSQSQYKTITTAQLHEGEYSSDMFYGTMDDQIDRLNDDYDDLYVSGRYNSL